MNDFHWTISETSRITPFRRQHVDYTDKDGILQRVEVKGTIDAVFTGVQMTRGELDAAKAHGSNYWLFLVAGCLTNVPRVQTICDPARKLLSGDWSARAELFSIRFAGND
jgi:hypothetical protein